MRAALMVLALVAGWATAGSEVDARIARVEDSMRLAARMAELKVPGVSIAVINDGKIEWARGYGLADVASGRPVTVHTRFQAGSITKPVVAMATLSLVQAGKLSLDQDVNQYLSAWKVPNNQFTVKQKVTLRALLSHTAGVGVHGFAGYPADKRLPTLLELLDGRPPANSPAVRVEALPDTAWKYSGGGYEIVHLLVTETAREPLDRFVQRTVLDQIGMRETSFAPTDESTMSHAHLADGGAVPGKWHRYPELAAAALWSTPSDIARFAIEIQQSLAGKSNKVLSQRMTRDMLAPGIETFGLGLFLGEPSDARPSFRHSGGTLGFRSMMFAYNDTGQGAVVMINGDNGGPLLEEVLRAVSREYGWTNYLASTASAR